MNQFWWNFSCHIGYLYFIFVSCRHLKGKQINKSLYQHLKKGNNKNNNPPLCSLSTGKYNIQSGLLGWASSTRRASELSSTFTGGLSDLNSCRNAANSEESILCEANTCTSSRILRCNSENKVSRIKKMFKRKHMGHIFKWIAKYLVIL